MAAAADDARQAGLGQHTGDGFGMHPQLPADRSDTPLFDLVVAQDLRLELRWNSHDRILFVGFDGSGVAKNPAAHGLNSTGHNSGSTIAAGVRATDCPAAIAPRPPPPDP